MLALNELSLAAPTHASDVALLSGLCATIIQVRNSVAAADRSNVKLIVPDAILALSLPSGQAVGTALSALKRQDEVLGKFATSILVNGPWYDSNGVLGDSVAKANSLEVVVNGQRGRGLTAAALIEGLSVSFATNPWEHTPVTAQVTSGGTVLRNLSIPNVWHKDLEPSHLEALAQHFNVLPIYENPGHHEPSGPNYVAGKAHIPIRAEKILGHALPSSFGATTWWAFCAHGFFHRFQGSVRGPRLVVHWNGTTNPRATQSTEEMNVPGVLRQKLRTAPARSCGCREL